jgi:hypothetical protein
MVEMIRPLLPDFPEANLKSMHDYQSLMGEVQDAEVFRQSFLDFAEKISLSGLESIYHYYEERHTEAIAAYAENRMQLHGFWRAESDKPFPWEKPQ